MIAKLLILKILQLFAIMLIGFIIAKLNIINVKDSVALSRIAVYLLMPSAIINAADFEQSNSLKKGLLLAFAAGIILHIMLYLLDILYGKFICKSPVERASVMYSNAVNIIIPIVSFVMGEEWVVFSTAYLSVQMVFLWSHGIRLFKPNEKFDIKKVVLNPNVIAILIGLIMMFSGTRLPSFAKDIISPFASLVGPFGMLIAGILAANINFKKALSYKNLYRVVIFRLVVCPILALLILKLLSLFPVIDGDKILLVSYLASIAPSASIVVQFSQINDSDTEYATAINIISTLACILTMPLFVMLFTNI